MQPCAGAWCRWRDRLRPSLHAQARQGFRPDGARSDRLQSARRPRKHSMLIDLRLPGTNHLHRRFQTATNRACSQVRHRLFLQACGHSRDKSKFLRPLVALSNFPLLLLPLYCRQHLTQISEFLIHFRDFAERAADFFTQNCPIPRTQSC